MSEAKKPAATRIYLVPSHGDGVVIPTGALLPEGSHTIKRKHRLVRAQNPSQVAAHITKDAGIRVASQDDLVEALKQGAEVEDAKEEPPTTDPLFGSGT